MRESADILVSYLIFPDRVKLLLRRLGVGVIARLDIIVLRGEAQIIFRRSGRCSLLIARRDGRLDPIETGLKIHSETARINGPTCLTPRKLLCQISPTLFVFHIPLSFYYFQTNYLYTSVEECFVEPRFCTRHAEGREGREKEGS